jgi:hypothetical protein
MSYPIKYPTPQGANIQIFQEGGSVSDWVKPQGASFVFFTLIGAGGGGAGFDTEFVGGGGGSGAITNFMCPAFLIPDSLNVAVAKGGAGGAYNTSGNNGENTRVSYIQKDGTGYTLLTAAPGSGGNTGDSGGSGGDLMTNNAFTAMGFLNSVDGVNGNTGLPTTTFLKGGNSSSYDGVYGYRNFTGNGFFQMQPIPVSLGGLTGATGQRGYKGGVGSGGGGAYALLEPGGDGGDGLVIIVTW